MKLFFVEEDNVEEAVVADSVPAVRGTMRLHQVVAHARGIIKYRDVSCFCKNPETLSCDCYDIKEFTFPTYLHVGTSTRPSFADQCHAAAQLTTVTQLVSRASCTFRRTDHTCNVSCSCTTEYSRESFLPCSDRPFNV